jgi:hypothetical protein
MAAWLTVYCARSVAHVTAEDLIAVICDLEDPYTLAECYGIEDEEEAVDRAMKHLRIEPVAGPQGGKISVRYKPPDARPVLLHVWSRPKRVQTERDEALEQFEDVSGRNVARVRKHLADCVEVAALELGWTQLEDMGIVFASVIAEFLAVEGNGLIRDQNEDWWAVKNGAPVLLVGPRRRP